jgi:hypothetical protein
MVTEKTLSDLRDSMMRNLYEDKTGPRGLQQDVKSLFEETYQNRARTIANTETSIAVEEVKRETFKRNVTSDSQKRWVAMMDNFTRDDHRAVNDTVIGINEKFNVGGDMMDGPLDPAGSPGEVINCRCSLEVLPGKVAEITEAWLGD